MKTITPYLIIPILILTMTSCSNTKKQPGSKTEYPITQKGSIVDEYFGVQVADPYRWLEDDNSEATATWVKAQNQVTQAYLEQIPFKKQLRERFDNISNYVRYSTPFMLKDKFYYFKNSGLQNHSVMYVSESKADEGEIFLDPNTFSVDGTTSLGGFSFSEDASLFAYTISEGGSDWRKIIVMDANSKEIVEDTIVDVKFSGISWYKNEGFFYCSYDKPEDASVLSGITMQHKAYYHKLGTKQSEDILVFGDGEIRRRYMDVNLFKHSDYVFISAAESTYGNELYIRKNPLGQAGFTQVVKGFESTNSIIYAQGEYFYVLTNQDAPNKRIVKVNVNSPEPENWETLVPEKKDVIESVSFAGGNFFVEYLIDASSAFYQYDRNGKSLRKIELPGIGTAYGFEGELDDKEVYFSFTSFTQPVSLYNYEIGSGKAELFKAPESKIDFDKFETKQVFYESKDGTKIPMFIVHKKGVVLNGNNPTLLYGYGGFNISLTPSFSMRWIGWLDMGGVLAVSNLRGGGEYGEAWHEAGTKFKKQNVFDDFIAAAEYLQTEKYTSSQKLTIMGASNGGLLVGAVSTQRPELFSVALPAVGVMDMLRYHKFTAGAGWISDYGCADSSKAMFEYLVEYSPVHAVKQGTKYPSTLVTTADHDDRVVPAHSYKYIARLQENHSGTNPVLIRIDTKAGHGAGKSTAMILDELADVFSFAFYNMGEIPNNVN